MFRQTHVNTIIIYKPYIRYADTFGHCSIRSPNYSSYLVFEYALFSTSQCLGSKVKGLN